MNEINELLKETLKDKLENIAPNYRKGLLSVESINRIIEKIASDIGVSKSDALAGIILLFLKGAASSGTPATMSVDLRNGKTMAKKNIQGAYMVETGNQHLRRLAEALAVEIGQFAQSNELNGELAQRINTSLKADTGENLTQIESAWCSSFSQHLPDLAQRSSERLVKLLAEDYKKRFESRKKEKSNKFKTIPKKGKK